MSEEFLNEVQKGDYEILLDIDNKFYQMTDESLDDLLRMMESGRVIVLNPYGEGKYDIVPLGIDE